MNPSTTFKSTFEVKGSGGALIDADALPTGTVYRNGVETSVTVTVTRLDDGLYSYEFDVPAWSDGDNVDVHLTCAVDSVTLSTKRHFEVSDVANAVWSKVLP